MFISGFNKAWVQWSYIKESKLNQWFSPRCSCCVFSVTPHPRLRNPEVYINHGANLLKLFMVVFFPGSSKIIGMLQSSFEYKHL